MTIYNLDPTSMALNSEVMVAAWSPAFSRAVAEQPRRLIARGAPDVYEYTIERDPAGQPVRDAEGRPRIAFGPEDHCDPGEWKALSAYWATLRAAEEFAGFSPLL